MYRQIGWKGVGLIYILSSRYFHSVKLSFAIRRRSDSFRKVLRLLAGLAALVLRRHSAYRLGFALWRAMHRSG
jgi:hypothetical protein